MYVCIGQQVFVTYVLAVEIVVTAQCGQRFYLKTRKLVDFLNV